LTHLTPGRILAVFKSKLHAVWPNRPSGKADGYFNALDAAFKPIVPFGHAPNWRVKRPFPRDRTVSPAARGLLQRHHALHSSLSPQYENISLRPLPASRFF
jgi:hypothetical protein